VRCEVLAVLDQVFQRPAGTEQALRCCGTLEGVLASLLPRLIAGSGEKGLSIRAHEGRRVKLRDGSEAERGELRASAVPTAHAASTAGRRRRPLPISNPD